MAGPEPSFEKSTFSWIWDGVDVSLEELDRLQPRWEIPETIVIEADLGHRTDFEQAITSGIECVRAGAGGLHMHIRDEHDREVGDPGVWREAIERIRDEVGAVPINRGLRGRAFTESISHLDHGLFASVPIQPSLEPDYVRAAVAAMRERDVVPDLIVFDPADINLAMTQLFDPGLLVSPTLWTLTLGYPLASMAVPGPSLMTRGLMHAVELIQTVDPAATIKVCATGRACSYTTTQAMLMGLDVRPGLGETPWRHPHRAELLADAVTGIADAATVARALGREPLAPADYAARLSSFTA